MTSATLYYLKGFSHPSDRKSETNMSRERDQFNEIMDIIEDAYKQGRQDHIDNDGGWFTEFRYRAKLREVFDKSKTDSIRENLPA